jgi:hypothetical protein
MENLKKEMESFKTEIKEIETLKIKNHDLDV